MAGLLLAASAAFAQGGERTLVVAPKQEVPGEARHALVIGNNAYAHGPLRNPVNDARAMSRALAESGFHVVLVENATQVGMQRAIRTFGNHIAKGGVGLFYYAGHGMQVKGRNYLIPVNAEIAQEDEIEFSAIDVNQVLAKMDTAKNPLNVVILDACRNNPFARNFRNMQAGLAQMDAPTGTFLAFATAPGSVAADGAGENGVYTKHLLGEMQKPGVQIEQLFKAVRIGVMTETKGRQIPWESSSLRGEFAFRPGAAPSVAEAVAAAVRREREAQQAELQKLQAALERQQKQLEVLGMKPAPVAPVVAAPPEPAKPVVTASAAPTAVSSPDGKLPRAGDTWTYRLSEPTRLDGPKQRDYTVKVSAVTANAILDQYVLDTGKPGEWAHSAGGYLAGLGRSLFAPYLFSFDNVHEYGPIRVQIVDPACSGVFFCEATAQVAGREPVKVPAGTFDTIKVQVDHSWRASGTAGTNSARNFGSRRLTIWYAPAVKRAVKYTSRPMFGQNEPVDTHFDLELVSYKVQ